MIDVNTGRMAAVSGELNGISRSLAYAEVEMDEIHESLRRQEPMQELCRQLKRAQERLGETVNENRRLTAALEQITQTYGRTETQISEMLDENVRTYRSDTPERIAYGGIRDKIDKLWK